MENRLDERIKPAYLRRTPQNQTSSGAIWTRSPFSPKLRTIVPRKSLDATHTQYDISEDAFNKKTCYGLFIKNYLIYWQTSNHKLNFIIF